MYGVINVLHSAYPSRTWPMTHLQRPSGKVRQRAAYEDSRPPAHRNGTVALMVVPLYVHQLTHRRCGRAASPASGRFGASCQVGAEYCVDHLLSTRKKITVKPSITLSWV